MCNGIVKDNGPFDFEKEKVRTKCENEMKKLFTPTRKYFTTEVVRRHFAETKSINSVQTAPFSSSRNGHMEIPCQM